MALEFASDGVNTDSSYSFEIRNSKTGYIVDWEQMVRGIIIDISGKVNWGLISAKFHNTLAEMILEMAAVLTLKDFNREKGVYSRALVFVRTGINGYLQMTAG